jgi:hypothetical protein
MKHLKVVLLGAAAWSICSCAPGHNPLTDSYGNGSNAGFWTGLWQGMICPISLVISWFNSGVTIYEVHNSGGWYNTGFVLGAGAWGVFGAKRSTHSDLASYDDDEIRDEAERRGLLEAPSSYEDDDDIDDYDEEDEPEEEPEKK